MKKLNAQELSTIKGGQAYSLPKVKKIDPKNWTTDPVPPHKVDIG